MKPSVRKYIDLFTVIMLLVAFSNSGCKKLVEVDPPITSTSGDAAFNNDATAIAVLTGIYSSETLPSFVTKRAGLSSDELSLWTDAEFTDQLYYKNELAANDQNAAGHEVWNATYPLIAACNSAIEGLSESSSLTPFTKQQLMGEAKFMRAFLYFYLVNLYGDVPLATTSDYKVNRLLPKSPVNEIYELVISDLKEAQAMLSSDYLNGKLAVYSGVSERLRPTSWAATALLARAYLYAGDYSNAENEASRLITNTSLFTLTNLSEVFLKNSNEAIWQLQPVNVNGDFFTNTGDAGLFVLTEPPVGLNYSHVVYMSSQLLNAFEVGDMRRVDWVSLYTDGTDTFYFPHKYKVVWSQGGVSEYLTVLRLGEQYLIRAEARAQLNNVTGSLEDLNALRARAGLAASSASDKDALLAAILRERQIELFAEWGHRWLDLKRSDNVDAVMSIVTPQKSNGFQWQSFQQWYPIPLTDLERNPSLIQNSGY